MHVCPAEVIVAVLANVVESVEKDMREYAEKSNLEGRAYPIEAVNNLRKAHDYLIAFISEHQVEAHENTTDLPWKDIDIIGRYIGDSITNSAIDLFMRHLNEEGSGE